MHKYQNIPANDGAYKIAWSYNGKDTERMTRAYTRGELERALHDMARAGYVVHYIKGE